MTGFILIDKPIDWTSFDVVAFIRKIVSAKNIGLPAEAHRVKVGHAGTLDPFATGLLIVAIGREATRDIDTFRDMPKTYEATIRLGATSDTGDNTGTITEKSILESEILNLDTVTKVLKKFVGKQLQTPPMYSAKKVNGQKLYDLARRGIEIERQPNEIEIYEIKINEYTWPNLKITVRCSVGTYIRTLAEDIGKELGCGAYCDVLRRTKIGEYSVESASPVDKVNKENIQQLLFQT
ncbi:MAG TPA: tRNA pseudouridine(55) synthase TruB [Candidatus Magasanikbacteria bacterium]|nr:tRNA pseudouridine(55) synthase TruB [Candidatus Magasanikbacteria bacterium]